MRVGTGDGQPDSPTTQARFIPDPWIPLPDTGRLSGMTNLIRALLALSLPSLAADPAAALQTSHSSRQPAGVVDTLHGVAVSDPYRWMENMGSPEVLAYARAQDSTARAWVNAPTGAEMPLFTASTPATSVVETAPKPTSRTPNFPSAGAIFTPFSTIEILRKTKGDDNKMGWTFEMHDALSR